MRFRHSCGITSAALTSAAPRSEPSRSVPSTTKSRSVRSTAAGFAMYVLRLNGAPVAVMYGFLYNGTFSFYQHGFDDQYQQHSIGLVLMALSIRAAIEEGAGEFDMLWGLEPYKFLWAHDTRRAPQHSSLSGAYRRADSSSPASCPPTGRCFRRWRRGLSGPPVIPCRLRFAACAAT